MQRTDLTELHFITHVDNVLSIHGIGILSNNLAAHMNPHSLADPGVQSVRATVIVPPGNPLHGYANLYINGRNPMLYRLVRNHPPQELAVIAVDPAVLDLPGVVITAQNAASLKPQWMSSPEGLEQIERDYVFSENWKHPDDPKAERLHILGMCAEVLVPDQVPPELVAATYVSCPETQQALLQAGVREPVEVKTSLFFGYRRR